MKVNIQKFHQDAIIPSYSTSGSACFDLHSLKDATIRSGGRELIGTGLKMEIPLGYEGQVRSRSGLAIKHGVFVLNSPGIIDSDYRGEIKIILQNLGNEDYNIKAGDRIAQMAIVQVAQVQFNELVQLSITGRGEGGFGSTGI